MAKSPVKADAGARSRRASPKAKAAGEAPGPSPVQDKAAIDYGPLPTLVGYRIRKAYSRLFQTFNEMLSGLNLAPGQYSVLALIGLNPGLSQMAVADATGIDRSTIVPITNRFVKLGWLRRVRRKDDRRVYSLRLTPLGQSILDQARPLIEAHEERLVGSLSRAERLVLVDLLARVTDPEADAGELPQPAKRRAPA